MITTVGMKAAIGKPSVGQLYRESGFSVKSEQDHHSLELLITSIFNQEIVANH